MPDGMPERGDFGLPKKMREKDQVVAIFDLVEYTGLGSNKDLVQAVRMLETELNLSISGRYFWDDRSTGQREKDTNNVLLRSTGDGYVVAFSEGLNDREILDDLTSIHSRVHKQHHVRLGINKGRNYIVEDVNERVNILGWGINLAARALGFAEPGQIVCTEYFAKPILKTDKSYNKVLTLIGTRMVKKTELELYNYYKRQDFGAPLTANQKKSRWRNRSADGFQPIKN